MRPYLWVLAACGAPTPVAPSPATPAPVTHTVTPALSNSAPASKLAAIEDTPAVDVGPMPQHAARDCRPHTVIRSRFAGQRVRACGALPAINTLEYGTPAWATHIDASLAGNNCIADAIAHTEPFVVEQAIRGDDSRGVNGLVAAREGDHLVLYQLFYDDNPCGGGCPLEGHTVVERCTSFHAVTKPEGECVLLHDCVVCDAPAKVADCVFGP